MHTRVDLSFPTLSEPKMQANLTALLELAVNNTEVQTAPTTGTPLSNYGQTIIPSTVAKTFTMAAPAEGTRKYIIATATSTAARVVNVGSGITVDGTNSFITFDAINEYIQLVGVSATRWAIVSSNGVALSTV